MTAAAQPDKGTGLKPVLLTLISLRGATILGLPKTAASQPGQATKNDGYPTELVAG
jgi:hypothetical protein